MDFFLQQTVNGLTLGSVFALFALGFSLVLANLHVFHVAHEGVFTWGAVFAWIFAAEAGLPFAVVLPLAVLGAGLLNVVAYFTLIKHLEKRKDRDLAGFISSVGGAIVLVEAAAIALDGQAVRLPLGTFPVDVWQLGPIQVSSVEVLIGGLALLSFGFLQWLVDRTELGREIKTVAYDREVASLLGIRVTSISALVFFISGAFAGLAATLVAVAFNVIDPNLGASYLVLAIAVTVLGGFGSVKGALIGGLIVGLVSAYTVAYLTSSYRDVVIFGLLMLFLIVRPTGLFGARELGVRA